MVETALVLSSAACGTHLLTGLLLVSNAFSTDTAGGQVAATFFLFASCFVVLSICLKAAGKPPPWAPLWRELAWSLLDKRKLPDDPEVAPAPVDLEPGRPVDLEPGRPADPGPGASQVDVEKGCSMQASPVEDTEQRLEDETVVAQVDVAESPAAEAQQAPGDISDAQFLEAPHTPSEEELPLVGSPSFETMLADRGLAVVVGAEDSVLEGLRQLLVHHLRKQGIRALTEAQAYVLEHHIPRLATYSEKIVATISFTQQAFEEQGQDIQVLQEGRCDEESVTNFDDKVVDDRKKEVDLAKLLVGNARLWMEQDASAHEEAEAVKVEEPEKKILKLQDAEILQLYDDAIKEAEMEADWRGIADWPAGSGIPAASSTGSLVSEEQKERREGLELLGQAFAFRERSNGLQRAVSESGNLYAASGELLKQQLLPANTSSRVPTPCGGIVVTGAPNTKAKPSQLHCCRMEQVVSEDLPPAPQAFARPMASGPAGNVTPGLPGPPRLPPVLEEEVPDGRSATTRSGLRSLAAEVT